MTVNSTFKCKPTFLHYRILLKIIIVTYIILCSISENLHAQLYVSDKSVYLDASQESFSSKSKTLVYIKNEASIIGTLENSEVVHLRETSAQKNEYLSNFAIQKKHRKNTAVLNKVHSTKIRAPKINNINHLVITDYKKQWISITESVGQSALLSGNSQIKFINLNNAIIPFFGKIHFSQLNASTQKIYLHNVCHDHFLVRPPAIIFTKVFT